MLLLLLLRFRGAEERSRFPLDLPRPGGPAGHCPGLTLQPGFTLRAGSSFSL